MKIRSILGSLCLMAACAAPAQSEKQISVTVADGVATVSPASYKFAKGQAAVTVTEIGRASCRERVLVTV